MCAALRKHKLRWDEVQAVKKLILIALVSVLVGCSGIEKSTQDLPSQTRTERMQSAEGQETKMLEKADSGSTGWAD